MNQNRILLFGALIGAGTGLVAAMILQRRAEKTGTEISLSTGEGIQLGVMVMGLLRAISSLSCCWRAVAAARNQARAVDAAIDCWAKR